MHFCGHGFVWPELIDPATAEPFAIETGVVGEVVYTTLVARGDAARAVPIGRHRRDPGYVVRMRTNELSGVLLLGDRRMFIGCGVNVYPSGGGGRGR